MNRRSLRGSGQILCVLSRCLDVLQLAWGAEAGGLVFSHGRRVPHKFLGEPQQGQGAILFVDVVAGFPHQLVTGGGIGRYLQLLVNSVYCLAFQEVTAPAAIVDYAEHRWVGEANRRVGQARLL